jgi:transcription termination factor Rho
MKELKLQDLKEKSAPELIEFAKENDVENASSLKKARVVFRNFTKLSRPRYRNFRTGSY